MNTTSKLHFDKTKLKNYPVLLFLSYNGREGLTALA